MRVLILYNAPSLAADAPDAASEVGVLESVEAFTQALKRAGHTLSTLALADELDPLVQLARGTERPEVVVNFCESFAGEPDLEPHLAAALDLLKLPYTGGPAETLWSTHDKARAKFLLAAAGLPAAAGWKILAAGPAPSSDEVSQQCGTGPLGPGPWFVKPAAQDASLGIGHDSVVTDRSKLLDQIEQVRKRFGDVLVEPYLAGREFNVSVIDCFERQKSGTPRVLPLAEVNFARGGANEWPIVTYDAKWSPESRDWNSTPVTCPADVDEPLAQRLRTYARGAFCELGCRDYARVDFRVDADGNPWILEVNANPDLSPSAGFARSLLAGGIQYDEFACRLVEAAKARAVR